MSIGFAVGCAVSNDPPIDRSVSPPLTPDRWNRLASIRVLFGHQSVGGNLVAGVERLQSKQGAPSVRWIESPEPGNLGGTGSWWHCRIGSNGDPRSKTAAFAALLDGPFRDRVDVAIHKYCYADISSGTDVDALFRDYRSQLEGLQTRHPGVRFIHVTVPLRTIELTLRTRIKLWLGRTGIWEFADNQQRHRFNQLMRNAYAGKQPLFDLAAAESTMENGQRLTYREGGYQFESLYPGYSDDGGHLNERGQEWVATRFLQVLAETADPR